MTKGLQQYRELNYTACFVAFLQGSALEDIADQFSCSLKSLLIVAREQHWAKLAVTAQAQVAVATRDDEALAELQINRTKNYTQAQTLRGELDKTLMLCTLWGKVPIAPQILKELATAAATIHDLTYRALGDKDVQRNAGEGSVKANEIHFHLPGAVAKPREVRAIDVTPAQPPPPPPPPS